MLTRRATSDAIVVFPAPGGPAIPMICLYLCQISFNFNSHDQLKDQI